MIPDITLGHEFAGEIVEIGNQVTGFSPGDRVAIRPSMPCGHCRSCTTGKPNLCISQDFMGLTSDGGYAEFIKVPVNTLYLLPDSVSFEEATFCEPLAVAMHGVNRGGIGLGSNVAITGAGTIGLLAMQAAIVAGAAKVFVIEPVAKRRELALDLGATAVFDPTVENVSKEIANRTDRIKADVTIEAAGAQAAMLSAPGLTARGGTIVLLGVMMGTCEFPFSFPWLREQSIVPSNAYDVEFPLALDLIARQKVQTLPLVTAKVELEDAVEKGFKVLTGKDGTDQIKILISAK